MLYNLCGDLAHVNQEENFYTFLHVLTLSGSTFLALL